MAYMKQGSNFLYDDTTGEVVGIKDLNGVDRFFANSEMNNQGLLQRGRPYIIAQRSIPVGIAPTGSIGNNGALTLGTALQVTHSNGIWLYFPASAISAGSAAGFYWTIMSSTTAGVIYQSTWNGTPYIPASNVPYVTTGPGAYTGVTTAVTLATVALAGGTMGKNGGLRTDYMVSTPGTANTKSFALALGAGTIHTRTVATLGSGVYGARDVVVVRNQGNQAVNAVFNAQAGVGTSTSSGVVVRRTVDTSANQDITVVATMATATDYMILEALTIEVMPR